MGGMNLYTDVMQSFWADSSANIPHPRMIFEKIVYRETATKYNEMNHKYSSPIESIFLMCAIQ